jgi:hypothetical protein
MSDDTTTCGKGLAEHSSLPAKIAELTDALAQVLAVHETSLDPEDDGGRAELDAYVTLTHEFRANAAALRAAAARMAGYRDLPMANHDFTVLASANAIDAFATFVAKEEELFALLQRALERDRMILRSMRSGA